MITVATYFVWFVFYSFVGWLWELIVRSIGARKFINSGFLNGPYCPIYGFGVIFMILLLSGVDSVFLLFLTSGSLACVLEYITSWLMEKLFHMRWWDYSNEPFNINGRICLLGFLTFGILGSVAIKFIHPLVADVTSLIPSNIILIVASILLVIILTDIIYTVVKLTKFNKRLKKFTKEFNEFIKQSRKQSEEFTEKVREDIQERFAKTQTKFYKRLSILEKHLLRDYPRLRSTRYNEALQNFRKLVKLNKAESKTKPKSKSNSTSNLKSDTKSKKG